VDTSSVEAPTAQALVARLGSKVLNDNLAGNDLVLLNFTTVEPEIVWQMSSQLYRCWLDLGKPDFVVWYF
jgi:hypothetical protein